MCNCWIHEFFKNRDERGRYNKWLSDVRLKERSLGCSNYLRVSLKDFELLLGLVHPHFEKKDASFRDAVPAHDRLKLTVLFLP